MMNGVSFDTAAQAQQADLCRALAAAKLQRADDPGANAYYSDGVWTVVCAPTDDNPQTIAARLERAGWMMRRFGARLVYKHGVGTVAQVLVRMEQKR